MTDYIYPLATVVLDFFCVLFCIRLTASKRGPLWLIPMTLSLALLVGSAVCLLATASNIAGETLSRVASYIYDGEQYMMMAEPRVPKAYTRYGYESDEYPDDEYSADGCSVFFMRFKEYEWDENSTHEDDYNKYYKDQVYHFEDDYGNDLEPSKEMQKIYEKDGIKWCGLDAVSLQPKKAPL